MPLKLRPRLEDGEFVFADLSLHDLPAVATIREREGLSGVVALEAAEAAGAPTDVPMRWISFETETSLTDVGITAAVTALLTERGIAANIIAGLRHDHVFVPSERAAEAMAGIAEL